MISPAQIAAILLHLTAAHLRLLGEIMKSAKADWPMTEKECSQHDQHLYCDLGQAGLLEMYNHLYGFEKRHWDWEKNKIYPSDLAYAVLQLVHPEYGSWGIEPRDAEDCFVVERRGHQLPLFAEGSARGYLVSGELPHWRKTVTVRGTNGQKGRQTLNVVV